MILLVAAALIKEPHNGVCGSILYICNVCSILHLLLEPITCPITFSSCAILKQTSSSRLNIQVLSLCLNELYRGKFKKKPSSTKSLTIIPLPFVFGRMAGRSLSPHIQVCPSLVLKSDSSWNIEISSFFSSSPSRRTLGGLSLQGSEMNASYREHSVRLCDV